MLEETWKSVKGWKGYYSISSNGRIKSHARRILKSNGQIQLITEKFLRHQFDSDGYPFVTLKRPNTCAQPKVHKLVAQAFIKAPQNKFLQIRHRDGNILNPRYSNLIYGTSKQNHNDMKRHGTNKLGVKNGRARLDIQRVNRIRRVHAKGLLPRRDILSLFDINKSTYFNVINYDSWNPAKWLRDLEEMSYSDALYPRRFLRLLLEAELLLSPGLHPDCILLKKKLRGLKDWFQKNEQQIR